MRTHHALLCLLLAACGGEAPPAPDPGGADGAASAPAPPPPSPPASALGGPWLEAEALARLPEDGPGLPDEAAARGLDYVNVSGAPGKPTILEAGGAGVALLDLGADGDLDAVFAQGLKSLDAATAGGGATLEVFANDGTGTFARQDPPSPRGWWTGLAAGDVDGDGLADLVAGGYGVLQLLRGLGAGADRPEGGLAPWDPTPGGGLMGAAPPGAWIADWTAARGAGDDKPEQAPRWATGLAFLDADLDGDLDLYVGQYLDLDPLDPPRGELGQGALAFPCWWKGMTVYCGPRGMTPQPDRLLEGDGEGGFAGAPEAWLPDHVAGFTLAVGAFDADFDGDTDLYVANDSTANLMLVNELRGEGGGFVDRGLTSGVAVNPDGKAEAGMGVAFGDVDRNGRLDLAVTNFSGEPTHLYLARERGFSNQSYRLGLANETRRLLSWSTHLVDFTGDGWLELFTANGHVYPQADAVGTGTRYAQADTLWRLRPDRPVERLGPLRRDSALARVRGSRGSAVGDLDGDGAPDLVVAALDAPCILGINRLGPGASRLVLHLEGDPKTPGPDGRRSTRDALGARVILVPKTSPDAAYALLGEVQTAVGYQSSSSPALHFGAGSCESFEELTVLWPSGRRETLGSGSFGRRLFLREGAGVVREEDL